MSGPETIAGSVVIALLLLAVVSADNKPRWRK